MLLYNLEIKKFLYIILAFQFAILGLVGLSALGLNIPILRQLFGFIYLAFIPGLLILRLLKLHRLGGVETLLYSVGLSIAFEMFLGFFVNILYPLIGISKPISLPSLLGTLTVAVLILCAIAYQRERHVKELPSQNRSTRWSDLLSPPVLLLLLLPVISVLGVFLVYLRQGNILIIILLLLIALIVISIAFNKFIPAKLYPLAIGVISFSLIWHTSLVSPSLSGFDIHYHYYLQKLIIERSIWEISLGTMSNSMLSIVVLAPLNSLIINLDGAWVYKVIYATFFSLVPLALFQAFRTQTDDKIAFLGAFFFMSFPSFFSTIPFTATQMIAELFLALSILSFLDKGINATQRAALLIIFGLSTVVSHYGLSYVYLLILLLVLLLLALWRSQVASELWHFTVTKLGGIGRRLGADRWLLKPANMSGQRSTLSGTYVMLFFVFALAWYMYASSGFTFSVAVRIVDHIFASLSTQLFSAEARDPHILQALGLAPLRGAEVAWEMARIVQYITQLFIVVGVIGLVMNFRKTRFHHVYIAMALASSVILALSIILPYFALALNMNRIYHITLFFLSPFFILGGMAVFRWLFKAFPLRRLRNITDSARLNLVVIIVLVPYFLFTSGLIFELTGATATSMPLSLYKADWSFFTHSEISAGKWLGEMEGRKFATYGDAYTVTQLLQYGVGAYRLPFALEKVKQDSYIFLRQWNIVHNDILFFKTTERGTNPGYMDLDSDSARGLLAERSKIYESSGAQIYGYR